MRNVEINSNGPSNKLLVPRGRGEFWLLVISGDFAGAEVALQYSLDCDNWIGANAGYSTLSFTEPGAMRVASGLYYRLDVSGYTNPLLVTVKPT